MMMMISVKSLLPLLPLLLLQQLLPQSSAFPRPSPPSPPLSFTLSPDGTSYSISLGGSSSSLTLTSPCTAFALRYNNITHSSCDASLAPDRPPSPLSGTDQLGAYTGYSISFNSGVFVASFRLYPDTNRCLQPNPSPPPPCV